MKRIDQFVELREEFDALEFALDRLRDDAIRAIEGARQLGMTRGCGGILNSFDDLLCDIHDASSCANDEVAKLEDAEEAELDPNDNPIGPMG